MVTVHNLIWHGITLQEIYGTNSVQIPEGYEYCGFYPPFKWEKFIIPPTKFLAKDREFSIGIWEPSAGGTTPRIIVKKTEDYLLHYKKCFTKTWTIKEIYGVENPVIPDGYEVEGFRFVEFGETFLELNREPSISSQTFESQIPKLILSKKKKLYAKIPLVSFTREEASTYVQFKDVADVYWRINLNKDVEIIEE